MREIKFKGISRANGKIVYGYLTKRWGGIRIDFFDEDGVFHSERIEDGSERQFTGLKDMYGTEIYEGDILCNGTGRRCRVEYNTYNACFDCVPIVVVKGDNAKGFKPDVWYFYCTCLEGLKVDINK